MNNKKVWCTDRTPFEMFILQWSMSTPQCSMLCSMQSSICRAVHFSCSGLFWTALNAVWISLTHCRAWCSACRLLWVAAVWWSGYSRSRWRQRSSHKRIDTPDKLVLPPDNAPTFRSKTFTRKKHWWNIIIPTCFRDNEKSYACTSDKSFINVNFHTNSN